MDNQLSGPGAVLLLAVWSLVGIGILVWYLFAMARLFPRLGIEAWHGWIPLWNEWKLIDRAGLPGWTVLSALIPGLGIVAIVMRTIAMHRIGAEAGVSAGYTVLGLFIPPLWATLLGGWLGTRYLTLLPGHAEGRGRGLPESTALPGTSDAYGRAEPQPAWRAPSEAPLPASPGFGGDAPAAPPADPLEALWAPRVDPWAPPAAPLRPEPQPAPPLGATTEREYERLASEPFDVPPAAAPFGRPVAPEPFSWDAAAAQPVARPGAEAVPPAPAVPPLHPVAAPAPLPVPAAPAAPITAVPQASAPEPAIPAAPPAPAAPAAPGAGVPAQSVRRPTGITDNPVTPGEERLDRTIVTAPENPAEDEFDRTVVVVRRPAFDWALVLPDGEALALAPDTVVGRRPDTGLGAATLLIPDPTRTLSKSHARLRFDGENWTVEDLGSTNGLRLLPDDGREIEVPPGAPVVATPRLLLGTLEVVLRRGGEA